MLLWRKGKDHRPKVTLGITGWWSPRVHINGSVRHLKYRGAPESNLWKNRHPKRRNFIKERKFDILSLMNNAVGNLTWEQKSVIIGSVLGDGHLRKIEGRRFAFLEIQHSIKAKEYCEWKYSILKSICKSPPKIRKMDEKREVIKFQTREHPEIDEIYRQFYEGKKKVVPKNFILNPLSLAIWFMDDGSKSRGSIYLNCQQFDWKSQRRLLHALRLMGIKARMNKDKKYYRIRILKESTKKFLEIIKPYLHYSMFYKLPG